MNWLSDEIFGCMVNSNFIVGVETPIDTTMAQISRSLTATTFYGMTCTLRASAGNYSWFRSTFVLLASLHLMLLVHIVITAISGHMMNVAIMQYLDNLVWLAHKDKSKSATYISILFGKSSLRKTALMLMQQSWKRSRQHRTAAARPYTETRTDRQADRQTDRWAREHDTASWAWRRQCIRQRLYCNCLGMVDAMRKTSVLLDRLKSTCMLSRSTDGSPTCPRPQPPRRHRIWIDWRLIFLP